MEQKIKNLIIFLAIIFLSPQTFAKNCVIDTTQSSAEFVATGKPAMIKISGKSTKLEGAIDFKKNQDLGTIQIDLNTFDTEMETRNEHMKEKYLEVNKANNKMAIFKLEKLGTQDFQGKLTLHGVEKNITGQSVTKSSETDCEATADFSLKLSEYNIEIPSYLGVTVAEDVVVKVSIKGKIL